MKRSLIALAIGTFALGIAEFSMMGILGDVATDLGVGIVKAGHLISAYSLGVAVGAPMLILLRKLPLRRLMLFLSAFILLGNAFASLAPDFWTLLAARFISGLPHGAFFGAGAIVCSRLASPGQGATAVAVMVGGMTVANVVGVPGATLVSNIMSWRLAFAIVAIIGAAAVLAIRCWVPVLKPLPDTGVKGQFRFLRSLAPWLIYMGVFFGQMSVYTWLSYVQPLMTEVTGFSQDNMTWIMMIVGAGMVVGNLVTGRLSDHYGAARVTAWTAVAAIPILVAIYFCAHSRILSLPLAFLAPAALFGIGGPLQYIIVRFAKGGEMLGGAGIQIAFNVSNAMAALIGGAVIHHGFGIQAPALAGVPLAVIGAIALFVLHAKYSSKGA